MLVIVIANNNQQNMFNSCRCELLNGELLHENWPNGEKYQLENGNNQCKNVFFPFYLCWFLAIRVFLCHVWKIVFNSKQCHLDDDLVIPVLFFEPFLVFLRSARGRCHCCFCHYTFFFVHHSGYYTFILSLQSHTDVFNHHDSMKMLLFCMWLSIGCKRGLYSDQQ